MSNNCTTHYHACPCREEQFKRIEEWALEAREVLAHYADMEISWGEGKGARTIIEDNYAGKPLATEVLAKFPGEKDE